MRDRSDLRSDRIDWGGMRVRRTRSERNRSWALVWGILVGAVSPACYRLQLSDCAVRCGGDGACPTGMFCSGGRCRRSAGASCPGALTTDAAPDKADGMSRLDGATDGGGRDSGPDSVRADRASFDALADAAAPTADASASPCPRHMYLNVVRQLCLPVHDLNGDGRADMIAANAGEIDALLSTGRGFTFAKWFDGQFTGAGGVYAADVTGDGYADGVALGDGYVAVVTTGGPGFGLLTDRYYSVWSNETFIGSKGTFTADVNGDGKYDVLSAHADGIVVGLSTGSRFGLSASWLTADLSGYSAIFIADMTGDGLADVILVNDATVDVAVSNGHSFGVPGSWRSSGVFGTFGTWFADVDGDGLADGVSLDASGVSVSLARSGRILPEASWYTGTIGGAAGSFLIDADGDGRADIVSLDPARISVALSTGQGFGAPAVWYVGQFRADNGVSVAPDPGLSRTP